MQALTAEQGQALVLLVEGHSMQAVANRVGVDRVTLWRWRRSPAFVAEYERLREEAHDRGRRILEAAVGAATGALVEIVVDKTNTASERLRAAEAILDRVGLAAASRVEVVEGDPEARLREIFGLVGPTIDVEPLQPEGEEGP